MIRLFKRLLRKYRNDKLIREYCDVEENSLKFSTISLDLRKPEMGKKYLTIGKESRVVLDLTVENSSGELCVGNHVFMGGYAQLQSIKL